MRRVGVAATVSLVFRAPREGQRCPCGAHACRYRDLCIPAAADLGWESSMMPAVNVTRNFPQAQRGAGQLCRRPRLTGEPIRPFGLPIISRQRAPQVLGYVTTSTVAPMARKACPAGCRLDSGCGSIKCSVFIQLVCTLQGVQITIGFLLRLLDPRSRFAGYAELRLSDVLCQCTVRCSAQALEICASRSRSE